MSIYIVESYGNAPAVIDAVYTTEQDADARATRLEAEAGINHFAIHCYPFNDFPIYAIEEARGIFRYGTKTDVKKFLASLERNPQPDYEYCTIHILDAKWASPALGKDQMGLLPHIHVNNDYLDAGWRSWL